MLKRRLTTWLVVSLLFAATRSQAATPLDLSKIDRSLPREPTYAGKPQYCLLLLIF